MALASWFKTFMTASSTANAAAAIGARTGTDAPLATAAELRAGSQVAARQVSPQLLSGLASTSGATAARPTDATVGFLYFDTTLGKPVFLKTQPSTWVDSAGVAA
jgi:hypothetical protein